PAGAPWRGLIGRLGLFGRSAIRVSVEACQPGIDPDCRFQRAVERSARRCALEAGQAPAGVDAPAGTLRGGSELALVRHEAQQLGLRSLPAAARARPDGSAHAALSSAPSSPSVGAAGTT